MPAQPPTQPVQGLWGERPLPTDFHLFFLLHFFTVRRRLGCSVCQKLLTEMTVYIVGGITHGLVATADVGEVHCRPQNEAKIDFAGFGIGLTVLLLAYSSRAMLSSMDSRREKQLALLDES